MGFRQKIKDLGKRTEDKVREVAKSPVGQKVKDVAEDVANSVNYFFTSDKAKKIYKDIEHKSRELRDDFMESLKPLPEDKQKESIDIYDHGMKNLDEELKNSKNQEEFESNAHTLLKTISELSRNLRGSNELEPKDTDASVPADIGSYLSPNDSESELSGANNMDQVSDHG